MKLQKLQIKNFISIKQATIDFEELNDGVFLISGPTGSGKSSMLDAVHWVLFGKTLSSNRASIIKEIRSTYAPANEDTIVTLTFNQDKVDYKVIRTLKKDGGTAVQLFAPGIIYDKVKEANEMLEKIIGLTVKQFDQMVMLEQGNFSKFLLADSRTRAEILRDIFDTQLFKDIELRFKDKCSDLKTIILNSTELEQSLLQGEMFETVESQITLTAETIKDEQARLDEFRARQKNAEAMLPDLVAYDQAYAVYKKAQDELTRLEQLKSDVEVLYKKRDVFTAYSGILDWYDSYTKIKADIDKASKDEVDYQKRIASVVVDEELSDKVATLQDKQNKLGQLLETYNQVDKYKALVEQYETEQKDLTTEKNSLSATRDTLLTDKNNLRNRMDARRAYEQQRDEVLKRDAERTRMQKDIDDLTTFIESNKITYSKVLSRKLMELGEPGICPICGAPYTPDHIDAEEAVGSIDAEQRQLETKKNQLEALKVQLESLPPLAEPECTEVTPIADLTTQWNQCVSKVNDIESKIYTIDKQLQISEGSLNVAKSELAVLEPTIADSNKEALETELEAAKQEYTELWAKVDDNEMAKRSRNLLEGYLKSVQDKLGTLKTDLENLMQQPNARKESDPELKEAQKHRADVDDYRTNINDYLYRIQQYEMLHNNLMSVEEPINPHPGFTADSVRLIISDANIGIEEAIQKISDAKSLLESRKELVRRIADIRAERKKNTDRYDQYTYIYNLLSGKNSSKISFETFVLHRQLEWILQSSNQYLHTLSAGQFELQVRWESTSGRTQGGLEITITDHFTGSTRPAQTYSGGELFMLSLSLSMGLMTAIDSLFTKHELNLLIIDEGFGTLDQECLNRTLLTLRELRNIKSVGIISHVQELIDSIPQGFIVEKTAVGSRIKMFKNI